MVYECQLQRVAGYVHGGKLDIFSVNIFFDLIELSYSSLSIYCVVMISWFPDIY